MDHDMDHSAHSFASHALAHEKAKHKLLKELHVRELHDGSYHIVRHHGDGHPVTEHSAKDLDHVHDHLEEHMGQPNEGEEAAEGGSGSPAEEMAEGEGA